MRLYKQNKYLHHSAIIMAKKILEIKI